jgi:hypothetical protein
MSRNNLLNIVTDVDTTNVKRPILSHKRSDTAHVISVVAEFVAPETVDVGVEDVVDCGEAMEIFAFLAFGTIPGNLNISDLLNGFGEEIFYVPDTSRKE